MDAESIGSSRPESVMSVQSNGSQSPGSANASSPMGNMNLHDTAFQPGDNSVPSYPTGSLPSSPDSPAPRSPISVVNTASQSPTNMSNSPEDQGSTSPSHLDNTLTLSAEQPLELHTDSKSSIEQRRPRSRNRGSLSRYL